MKFATTTALVLLSACSAAAFAPTSTRSCVSLQTRAIQVPTIISTLNLKDNSFDDMKENIKDAKDDVKENLKDAKDNVQDNLGDAKDNVQEKVENAMDETQGTLRENLPGFLVVNLQLAEDQLVKNWRWIITFGGLTMALGAGALLMPTLATGVAYDRMAVTVGAVGVLGLINAIVRENGHRVKSAATGLLYLGLSFYMGSRPARGLRFITSAMAAIIASEGLFDTLLAAKNKSMQSRGWHAVTGIGSIIVGFCLSTTLPTSGLVAPGYALAARCLSSGATKVAVGLKGKDLADKRVY